MAENMEVIVSALDQASEVFSQIASQAQEMSDIIASSIDEAGIDFDTLGSSAGGVKDELDQVGDESNELSGSMDSASQATDLLVGAMEGVVATEVANALNECIDTASSYEDQMNSLSLTFGESTVNSTAFKNAISQASSVTGRAGSSIRDYFNQMGIAGVTNTTLLEQSFESLSGKAVQTGGDINSMANLMERMVLSGNVASRSLTQLGLSTDDLGRVMGVSGDEAKEMFSSLSQEERLRVLTEAMGSGAEANTKYKNSFSGMKQQLENQLGLVARNIGTSMLPIMINSLKVATPVLNGFATALGNPIIGGAVAVIGSVVTALMGLSAASKMASIAVDGYNTAVTIARTLTLLYQVATGQLTTAKLAELAAEEGNTAAKIANNIASTVAVVKNGLLAVSEGIVTAAQWALNVAMDANPVGILVIAITALIAVLGYLYFNNETVRNSVNALGSAIQSTVIPALQYLWTVITQTISFLGKLWVGFTKSITYAQKFVTGVLNYIKQLPTKIYNYIHNTLSRISSGMTSWISTARSKASAMVQGVMNYISDLPGKVYTEFVNIGTKIKQAVSSAVTAATQFGSDVVDAVLDALSIHSPGIIQRKTVGEFEDTITRINGLSSEAYKAGSNIGASFVSGYGDVDLSNGLGFANGLNISSTSSASVTGDKGTLKVEVVHDLKNDPNVDTNKAVQMINSLTSSKEFVVSLAQNIDFQNADSKMKNRLTRKSNRVLGV